MNRKILIVSVLAAVSLVFMAVTAFALTSQTVEAEEVIIDQTTDMTTTYHESVSEPVFEETNVKWQHKKEGGCDYSQSRLTKSPAEQDIQKQPVVQYKP